MRSSNKRLTAAGEQDMPEMRSGELQQTLRKLHAFAHSAPGAFGLSRDKGFERVPVEITGYLATVFAVICKHMPTRSPIAAITLRSQLMCLSNLFNIACSLDFLLENVAGCSPPETIEACLVRAYASTQRVLEVCMLSCSHSCRRPC